MGGKRGEAERDGREISGRKRRKVSDWRAVCENEP